MKGNVGGFDRAARITVGALLVILTLTGVVGAWGWIGVVPLATGLLGACPLYRMFGFFNTLPASHEAAMTIADPDAGQSGYRLHYGLFTPPSGPASRSAELARSLVPGATSQARVIEICKPIEPLASG